jgi:lipopolysaccharide/colanic/teichoic acid biosynthesis glycosyltransferase
LNAVLKRLLDIWAAALGLIVASPVLLPVMFLVWLQDGHSPFYIAPRVGRNGVPFKMIKMRSMVIDADRKGASSTSNDDVRITPVGNFIRRFKIDELTQLWNVLKGDMSLVGPRPQVQSGVDLYTTRERELLNVRPGITDFASIVFADEGDILAGHPDPDAAYDQLIRPGKSFLSLFYVRHSSISVDVRLVLLTLLTLFSRRRALQGVQNLLEGLGAPADLLRLASRENPLVPMNPPSSRNDFQHIHSSLDIYK